MADINGTTSHTESDAKRQKLDDQPQKTTLKEFEAVFPKLEADLLEHAQKYKLPKAELEWFKTVSLFHASLSTISSSRPRAYIKKLTANSLPTESGDQCGRRKMQPWHVGA